VKNPAYSLQRILFNKIDGFTKGGFELQEEIYRMLIQALGDLIDSADLLLQYISDVGIKAITMTDRSQQAPAEEHVEEVKKLKKENQRLKKSNNEMSEQLKDYYYSV
jgi:hypothetical protein